MWTFTEDVSAYASAAEAFLSADPVGNTVPLTVLVNLRNGMPAEGAYFGWWTSGGQVRGACFRTPPFPFGVTSMPSSAVAPLVEALAGRDIPEVAGPVAVTDAFTAALGRDVDHVMSERLYRLGTLRPPAVPGRGRVAVAADFAMLVSWFQSFHEDAGLRPGDFTAQVARRLGAGELLLWESPDGVPAALAALHQPAGGVCRIGPVYTPASMRRQGYGSAVTAFASRTGLDKGAQLVLFTDLANPTSNAIYQAIGYEPVTDYAQVTYKP